MHVLVDDVFYLTAATVTRVGLDVNTFERFLEICVSERNIPNTVMLCIRRHTANRQPNPKSNRNILNQHMLSTVTGCPAMTWFWDDDIIVILDCYVPDMEILACWVDAVCVEWK